MLAAITEVNRKTRTATVRLRGDLVIPTAPQVFGQLRGVARRRDVKSVIVDFSEAGRMDSAGLAVVSLGARLMARGGKAFDFANLGEVHRAALELLPESGAPTVEPEAIPTWPERVGATIIEYASAGRDFVALIADVFHQGAQVLVRRKKLPAGALLHQVSTMGVDAIGIIGLLGMLLGTTLAFQALVLLQRFGAGVFAADMIGVSMVREFGPLMTAVILTGRTGAAIAAELGTMRVRSELDALDAMGVSPTRFLMLPRLLALTVVQPALTMMCIFLGIGGGLLVMLLVMHLPPSVYWEHVVSRVNLEDWALGMGKSVVFAWIIGFTGCHFGMRTSGDATGVGEATTRTVVVGVFLVIMVDAVVATVGAIV